MPPRNGTHKAQPQAVSRCRTTRFEAHKAVEHTLALGFGYARPMVPDLQVGTPADLPDRDGDVAAMAVAAVFEGVVEQVGDRLR